MAGRSQEPSLPEPESMTCKVVAAVADHLGEDPLEMSPPLYAAIDGDALEALFPATDASGRSTLDSLEFTYQNCRVLISGDGSVEVVD